MGYFGVITEFDEIDTQRFLNNSDYLKIKKYLKIPAVEDVIFKVNTGAMTRKVRETPYLGEELLFVLKTEGGKVMLSSDSHSVDTPDYCFDEVERCWF